MFASIPSAVLIGAVGQTISVEVHVDRGLPGFNIVGPWPHVVNAGV